MTMRLQYGTSLRRAGLATAVAISVLSAPSLSLAQGGAEKAPVLRASELLAGYQLTGPNYAVAEAVQNDGFMNHYSVTVDGEAYTVSGDALMRERLHELAALQGMEKIKRTDVYKNAVKGAAKGTVGAVKGLVTAPIDTVKGVASGFGSFFKGVGHSIFGGKSDQEEGVMKTAIGFDVAKRKFAAKFGIDPYTSFPPVRERLDEVAWAGVAGNLTVSAAFQALPSGASTAVGAAKTSGGMMKLVYDNSPAELKELNERRLEKMKVEESIAELFLEHPKFSPSQKALLVEALARVGAYNRQAVIQRAILVQNESMAYFMRRWAQMIANYHIYVKPVRRFVRLGRAPFVQREDGVIVGLFPLDHLAWTEAIAGRYATNVKDIPGIDGLTGGEIWVEGTMSPKARALLESQNWVVKEKVGGTLKLN